MELLVGEGPDGISCRGGSRWNCLPGPGREPDVDAVREKGEGVSVCGWIETGNCEDYVNHESRQKIVIHG